MRTCCAICSTPAKQPGLVEFALCILFPHLLIGPERGFSQSSTSMAETRLGEIQGCPRTAGWATCRMSALSPWPT